MQASSEELQSSNEELQTSNEELQATNEELTTVNEALQIKSVELTEANAYLENVQHSIDIGLVVVDRDAKVLRFTPKAVRVFGILPSDVGQPLTALQHHVRIDDLNEKIHRVIADGTVHSEQLGRDVIYLLQISPYYGDRRQIQGAVLTFTEVTELQRMEEALKLRNAALEKAADGLIISDARLPDQPIVYASPAFHALTGYSEADILGQNCRFLQGPETDPAVLVRIREALQSNRPFLGELLNYRKNGSTFWNQLRINPLFDEHGEVTHFVGVQTDITERKQREAVAIRQANYDPLTGLPNRNLLASRLKRFLHLSERHASACYLLFIDLDGFKEINDTLGHAIGDELLVQAAARLEGSVRETDTVARFGGDEFIIVLPEIESLDTVMRVADTVLAQLRAPFSLSSGSHRLSASVGIAAYPEDAHDPEALIQHADTAMYRAKTNGRNGVAFFQTGMKAEAVRRSELKQSIFAGIDEQQFELHYQPIVDLTSRKLAGAEALLRWRHPDNGLMLPDQFLAVAEETGQLLTIGQWAIERAVKQLTNWMPLLNDSSDFRLAINLSPRQLQEPALHALLGNLPEPLFRHLAFEITESVLLENLQTVRDTLQLIRAKHGRVSIDDFGTGYSSLRYLQNFPVDTVKIDREFIANSHPGDKGMALIDTILTLAQRLDADVVAEGVETDQQLRLLAARPCRYGQGFFFHRPMPAAEFERLLH